MLIGNLLEVSGTTTGALDINLLFRDLSLMILPIMSLGSKPGQIIMAKKKHVVLILNSMKTGI